MAIASASDRAAGVWGACCAAATAGPSRSPAVSNTCLMGILGDMVVRSKPIRAVPWLGFDLRHVPCGCSRLDKRNLIPGTLGGKATGGDFYLHQACVGVEPEVHDQIGAPGDRDVSQRHGRVVQCGGREALILDFDRLAP